MRHRTEVELQFFLALFVVLCALLFISNDRLSIDSEKVTMLSWREHPVDFIDIVALLRQHHQVTLEMINVQVKLDRLELVMRCIIVAAARLKRKAMLSPAFANPAIRMSGKFQGFLITHNSHFDFFMHRYTSKYATTCY